MTCEVIAHREHRHAACGRRRRDDATHMAGGDDGRVGLSGDRRSRPGDARTRAARRARGGDGTRPHLLASRGRHRVVLGRGRLRSARHRRDPQSGATDPGRRSRRRGRARRGRRIHLRPPRRRSHRVLGGRRREGLPGCGLSLWSRTTEPTTIAALGHACTIDATGRVACQGDNHHGQLGLGDVHDVASPSVILGYHRGRWRRWRR